MFIKVATAGLLLLIVQHRVRGKVYDRCELARELRDLHDIPEHQLATWVCIANYESEFNTSAVNTGSGDHGIFQISDQYWCSPPGNGYACGQPCSAFEDDDIEDDVVCAKRIFREHKRLSGNGFNAWTVYHYYCKNPSHVQTFMDGCFSTQNEFNYQTQHYSKYSSSYYYNLHSSLYATSPPLVQFNYEHRPQFYNPPAVSNVLFHFTPSRVNYNSFSSSHSAFENRAQKSFSQYSSNFNQLPRGTTQRPNTVHTYFPFLHPFTMKEELIPESSLVSMVTVKPDQPNGSKSSSVSAGKFDGASSITNSIHTATAKTFSFTSSPAPIYQSSIRNIISDKYKTNNFKDSKERIVKNEDKNLNEVENNKTFLNISDSEYSFALRANGFRLQKV